MIFVVRMFVMIFPASVLMSRQGPAALRFLREGDDDGSQRQGYTNHPEQRAEIGMQKG